MESPRKIATTKLNSMESSPSVEPTTYAVQNRKKVKLPARVKENLLRHVQPLAVGANQ